MFNEVFPKIMPPIRYVEEYGTAGETTDDSMISRKKDAICMPDNEGKNTDTQSYLKYRSSKE
jgi:hypothetical protein